MESHFFHGFYFKTNFSNTQPYLYYRRFKTKAGQPTNSPITNHVIYPQ